MHFRSYRRRSLFKTLTGGLMVARNPCLKAITGLPNCTDNDFCFLPKDKGGLGYEAANLVPIMG